MNKFLVAVFNNEAQSYEGKKALFQLHIDGEVTIFASALIVKDRKGEVSIKYAEDEGPIGTATGLLAGAMSSIIALAAGTAVTPVTALAVDTSVGGLGGIFEDLYKSGVDLDFVDTVSRHLKPGM